MARHFPICLFFLLILSHPQHAASIKEAPAPVVFAQPVGGMHRDIQSIMDMMTHDLWKEKVVHPATEQGEPAEIMPGQSMEGSLKGEGWQYYYVDVDQLSFLDVVLTLHSEARFPETCPSLHWEVQVNKTKPSPVPTHQVLSNELVLESVFSAFLGLVSQAVMCDVYSYYSTTSIKKAEPTRWWIKVQTSSPTKNPFFLYDNNSQECHFHVDVSVRPRDALMQQFLIMFGVMAVAVLIFVKVLSLMHPHLASFDSAEMNPHAFLLKGAPFVVLVAVVCISRTPKAMSDWVKAKSTRRSQQVLVINDAESQSSESRSSSGSKTPRTEDSEDESCRICRDYGTEPLIKPCACSGSLAHVHRSCLDRWRRECLQNGNQENTTRCEICHADFTTGPPEVQFRTVLVVMWRNLGMQISSAIWILFIDIILFIWVGWVTRIALGPYTCMQPFEKKPYHTDIGSIQTAFIGVIYYSIFALYGYWAFHFKYMHWLSALQVRNEDPHDVRFLTLGNILQMILIYVAVVAMDIGLGYTTTALLYIFAERMSWAWELPIVLGFCVMMIMTTTTFTLISLREELRVEADANRDREEARAEGQVPLL